MSVGFSLFVVLASADGKPFINKSKNSVLNMSPCMSLTGETLIGET